MSRVRSGETEAANEVNMPDRESASFCRPRLYDKDDPEADDDVSLVLDGIDMILERAMDNNNEAEVSHASDLKRRLLAYAGPAYEHRQPNGDEEAEA